MPESDDRGPRHLADVLADLFVAKGFGQSTARSQLESAWKAVVGIDSEASHGTRVHGLRRGVLRIVASHSALVEELAGFRRDDLIAQLNRSLPETPIRKIRFQLGPVSEASPASTKADHRSGRRDRLDPRPSPEPQARHLDDQDRFGDHDPS